MKIPPPVREIVTLDAGDSDVYGWAMGHLFAIAETLYANREYVPDAWQFRCPWPPETRREHLAEIWPDEEYFAAYDRGDVTADRLRQAGEVMRRYVRRVRCAGRDY